jgi:hypothetical protein
MTYEVYDELKNIISKVANPTINWKDQSFDLQKALVCAKFSQLAYTAIEKFEFEARGRFKLIPCIAYYDVILQQDREKKV